MNNAKDYGHYQNVDDWCRDKPLSRGATYAAIREGRLPHVRIGRKVLIPRDALDRMVTGGSMQTDERQAS